jgi:hypothetical protein
VELRPRYVNIERVKDRPDLNERCEFEGGVGFCGIAEPFVVRYVDVGYGSEGGMVFSSIDYPF